MKQKKYSPREMADIFLEKMSDIANEYAGNAPFNKIVWGIVTAVTGATYTLNIRGKTYPNTPALVSAGTLDVNDTVICVIPNNNAPNMFILGKIQT